MPLSHAICCRPCLPSELPDSLRRAPDPKALALAMPHSDPKAITHSASIGPEPRKGNGGRAIRSHEQQQGRLGPTADVLRGGGRGGGAADNASKPLAVISIGCHPSSGRASRALQVGS